MVRPIARPYSREFFAPRPAAFTLFFRTFVLWQLVRFVWVNIKMIRMIGKSHSHRALPPAGGTAGTTAGADGRVGVAAAAGAH